MKNLLRIIAFALTLMMLLGIVACAEPIGTETAPHSEESEEKTTETEGTETTVGSSGETVDSEGLTDGETVTEEHSETENDSSDVDAADSSATEPSTESGDVTEMTESSEASAEMTSELETETETETHEVGIFEKDGYASVYTKDGLAYSVSGYKSVEGGAFVFDTGLEISFDEALFASEFNRLTFNYKVSEPIKLFVTYMLDGEEVAEYFFLEAAKTSFRGLIDGYLENKKGIGLKKLRIDTCEEISASFMLNDLRSEVIPLYENDLCVESDRYKIGVRLSWGGAMTYFEDKMDGDDALGNLVNIHDTGRLIQQSFYGTYSNGEYVSAEYSNSKWPYNPVQGGNKYQSGRPKLIDVEVGEDYIYVLAQSLDWAHDDLLTYTYYENTYTIKDDHVVVDNVATDFSGWEHPAGGQEIPAVYLVSYFDTLSFYNGIKPWTNDDEGICYERELGGWSESKTISLYKGNTETWSIWINSEDNFGFGTYCPNIQKHIAIRHQYDGSKDPMANSTSYVAPSCSIVMKSYEPIVYSYILATGSPEEIREVFKENKDFTDNASLSENRYDTLIPYGKFDMENIDFSAVENVDIVHAVKHMSKEYDSAEQAMKLTVEIPSDPQCSIDFDWNSDKVINSDDFNSIEIVYMLPVTNSKASDSFVIFACAGEVTTYNEKYAVNGTVIRDGEYHTLTIKLPDSKCLGDLHKFRLDPFTGGAVGDTIYIKSIRLTTTPEAGIVNDMTVKGSELIFSSTAHSNLVYDEDEGAVKVIPMGNNADVNFILNVANLNLLADEYVSIAIEYMLPETNSKEKYTCTLYFETLSNKGYNEKKTVYDYFIADGEYHTLILQMSKNELWTGDINTLRFDYFQNGCTTDDVIYIKNISFVADEGHDIDFTAEGSEKVFSSENHTAITFDESEGALRLEVNGGMDVYVILDLSEYEYSTEEYSKLYIRYRVPLSNSKGKYSSTVYFTTTESGSYSESKAVYSALTVDGLYHTLVVDLSQKATWTGNIVKIRFDFFQSDCADGDVIFIEYMSLK